MKIIEQATSSLSCALAGSIGLPIAAVFSLAYRVKEISLPILCASARFLRMEGNPLTWEDSYTLAKQDLANASTIAYHSLWNSFIDILSFEQEALCGIFSPTEGWGKTTAAFYNLFAPSKAALAAEEHETWKKNQNIKLREAVTDVGLPNLGNSCWMNSSIQFLYHLGDVFHARLEKKIQELQDQSDKFTYVESFLSSEDPTFLANLKEECLIRNLPGSLEKIVATRHKIIAIQEMKADIKKMLGFGDISLKNQAILNREIAKLIEYEKDARSIPQNFLDEHKNLQKKWNKLYPQHKIYSQLYTENLAFVLLKWDLFITLNSPKNRALQHLSNILDKLKNHCSSNDPQLRQELVKLNNAYIAQQNSVLRENLQLHSGRQQDSLEFCLSVLDWLDWNEHPPQEFQGMLTHTATPCTENLFYTKAAKSTPFSILSLNIDSFFTQELEVNEKAADQTIQRRVKALSLKQLQTISPNPLTVENLNDAIRNPTQENNPQILQKYKPLLHPILRAAEKAKNQILKTLIANTQSCQISKLIQDKKTIKDLYSDNGDEKADCEFTSMITKYPEELIVEVRRSSFLLGKQTKLSVDLADIDQDGRITFQEDESATISSSQTYEVASAILHTGIDGNGHYVTLKKKPSGSFFVCNDNKIVQVPQSEALRYIRQASLLRFIKINSKQ